MKNFMRRLLSENADLLLDPGALVATADKAAFIVRQALLNTYVHESSNTGGFPLRLSTLGKYSEIELAAKYFGIVNYNPPTELRIKRLLLDGFLFEAELMFELRLYGYEIMDTQHEVTWHGITGHPDFLVVTPESETWVVDAKTCNDFYFKTITRNHVYDDRGYMTQLALYSEATGFPACLVFKNKDTSEIAVFFMDGTIQRHVISEKVAVDVKEYTPNEEYTDVVLERIERAKEVTQFLVTGCDEWDDVFAKWHPPTPKMEMEYIYEWSEDLNKRVKVGETPVMLDGKPKFYVPSNVEYPELMYELSEGVTAYGKKRMYVTDFKYPERYLHNKPNLMDVYENWRIFNELEQRK